MAEWVCKKCGGTERYIKKNGNWGECKQCRNIASKKWKAEHPDQTRAIARKWAAEHPDRVRATARKRRTIKQLLPCAFTPKQERHMFEYFNHCCAVCGRSLNGLFHTGAGDHWIALSDPRLDNPGTVAANMLPLCHGIDGCNNSKYNLDPVAWLTEKFGKRKAAQILKRIETYFESVKEHHAY